MQRSIFFWLTHWLNRYPFPKPGVFLKHGPSGGARSLRSNCSDGSVCKPKRVSKKLSQTMSKPEEVQSSPKHHIASVTCKTDRSDMQFYASTSVGRGHQKWWAVSVCLSVCLSVTCLDVTRERKGIGSPKLSGWKPITRVTRKPI